MDNIQPDQKIKDFFNSRTIQPTQASWDRIDAMLDIQQNSRPLRAVNIGKIAAIAIFFCTISGVTALYFTSFSENKNLVVNKEIDKSVNLSGFEDKKNLMVDMEKTENPEESRFRVKVRNEKFAFLNQHTPNTDKSNFLYHIELLTTRPPSASEHKGDTDSVVEEVGNEYNNPNTNTTVTISASELLQSVEADIAKTRKLAVQQEIRKKYHINPSDLLKEAEEKAAQSFMVKVWKNIQDKSEIVITAVSERNQAK
jgi:hypothetical protein